MAEIKRCYGISTGTGYLVGAGGTGKTPELDNMVKEAAEALKDTFNRSEERRVGKECASMCRSRWSPYH